MTPAEIQVQLRSARSEPEHVCKLLESPAPATLDRCAAGMLRVITQLDTGRKGMVQIGEEGAVEARRLRATVHRARTLLNLAARYHTQWRSILAGMSGGYTVLGSPVPILSPARVSIQG